MVLKGEGKWLWQCCCCYVAGGGECGRGAGPDLRPGLYLFEPW